MRSVADEFAHTSILRFADDVSCSTPPIVQTVA
jgi:hypothetical protein